MTIDPRWSIGLAVLLAVLNYVTGAGALLADTGLDPTFLKHTLAYIAFFSGILATVNAILTGIPSKDNQTGFIVKGPKP